MSPGSERIFHCSARCVGGGGSLVVSSPGGVFASAALVGVLPSAGLASAGGLAGDFTSALGPGSSFGRLSERSSNRPSAICTTLTSSIEASDDNVRIKIGRAHV